MTQKLFFWIIFLSCALPVIFYYIWDVYLRKPKVYKYWEEKDE